MSAPEPVPPFVNADYGALLQWLSRLIHYRMSLHFGQDTELTDPLPALEEALAACPAIQQWMDERSLSTAEKVTLLLALSPHLDPDFLNREIQACLTEAGDFPLLGGQRGRTSRSMLPTGQTAAFLLGGSSVEDRLRCLPLFGQEHRFAREHILQLEEVAAGEPLLSGRLLLSPDLVGLWLQGREPLPRFSAGFPAEQLQTDLTWDDLVLLPITREQIAELLRWVRHQQQLMEEWGMRRRLKPGYRALFHGPPGTGKTLTATLLGKVTGRPVYRVDLSQVVSKYIGETEKNLAGLFDRARHRDWILFFDEADALFGKRTSVRDAHDRYANQEVSYLLQRVEEFAGLVILATNFKNNIDDAFQRRFQSVVSFPMPGVEERRQLWELAWPAAVKLDEQLGLGRLAENYELSGANIMNVVQYACLLALDRQEAVIRPGDVVQGIRREYAKEGRIS